MGHSLAGELVSTKFKDMLAICDVNFVTIVLPIIFLFSIVFGIVIYETISSRMCKHGCRIQGLSIRWWNLFIRHMRKYHTVNPSSLFFSCPALDFDRSTSHFSWSTANKSHSSRARHRSGDFEWAFRSSALANVHVHREHWCARWQRPRCSLHVLITSLPGHLQELTLNG